MDLRMSAGPVLRYGGTPKFGPFFPNIWSFWIFLAESTIIVCFSCVQQLLMGTTVEKFPSSSNIMKDIAV